MEHKNQKKNQKNAKSRDVYKRQDINSKTAGWNNANTAAKINNWWSKRAVY